MPGGAARIDSAVALTPDERRATCEAFFSAHPGAGVGRFGLGQAILDFQAWEVESGRITESGGSAWWRAVNGLMVLDIADAHHNRESELPPVCAWQTYTSADGTQAALWEAHQRSLHAAVRLCVALLDREPAAEREFAQVVIDIVDRTALAGQPTDNPGLADLTRRFYPWSYPVGSDALPRLELLRERTAERLRSEGGAVFADVGTGSSRWQ